MLKQLGCASLLLLAGNAIAGSVPATHHALNYEGRTIKDYSGGTVQFNWLGTSVKTQFSGSMLKLTLIGNGDHFDVLIDGKFTQKLLTNRGNQPQTFTLFESDTSQNVLVEIIKRTENYDTLAQVISFDHDGGLLNS